MPMGHPKKDNFGGKMYIKNGICYAGKFEEGIKVSEVKPLRGMIMLVTFSTGEKSTTEILSPPCGLHLYPRCQAQCPVGHLLPWELP